MGEWNVSTIKEHFDALRADDKEAVKAAFDAAAEKSARHNDLIREGQRKEATYVTKAELYATVMASAVIVGTVVTILNFILK